MQRPIRTAYEHPPGPCAPFWQAWLEDDDGEEARPRGTGATEAEAIDDLNRQLEELA